MNTEAQARALEELSETLRTLAANIVKVIRGKGEPPMIVLNAHDFVAAVETYKSATGSLPSGGTIRQILRVDLEPHMRSAMTEEQRAEASAVQTMIGASLQLAGARLLSQEDGARTASAALHRALSGLEEEKRAIALRRSHEEIARQVAPAVAAYKRDLAKQ